MKKQWKVLMGILVMAFILVGLRPALVKAAPIDCGDIEDTVVAEYDSATKTVTVSGYGPMKDYLDDEERPWPESWVGDIEKLVVEPGVTSVGDYAFYGFETLAQIELADSVVYIGAHSFEITGLETVKISSKVQQIKSCAFSGCRELKSINVDSKNKAYSSKGGVLFNKKKTSLMQYPPKKKGSKYTMPNSVKTIKGYAFSGYEGLAIYPEYLKKLVISKNIKKIEQGAFEFTIISKMYFPKKRPKIEGKKMFDDGMGLKIYYKKAYWPKKYRKKYGAHKVTWKRY